MNFENNFGTKYSNFSKILSSIESYFLSQSEKNKYTSALNVKDIQINELLMADNTYLFSFAELLVVMASITANKELFIERISEAEEKYMEHFLCVIEKYMIVEGTTNTSFISHDVSGIFQTRDTGSKRAPVLTRHSAMDNTDMSKMLTQIDVLSKKIETLEGEKDGLTNTIKQYHSKVIDLQSDNDSLLKEVTNHKEELKSNKVELDILKANNIRFLEANDDFIKETLTINNLKNIILQKDVEIEETKKESDKMLKTYTDQITLLNEKIIEYEDKEKEYRQLNREMDKLKHKNKELVTIKEKYSDYEELRANLDRSQGVIDNLNKEKNGLLSQIENINSELIGCKERLIQFEFEKKKFEYNTTDLQNKLTRLEDQRFNYTPESKRQSSLQGSASKALVELDLNDRKFDQIEVLEREFNELMRDRSELEGEIRAQTDQINDLVYEKQQLVNKVVELEGNIKTINNEMDKVKLDRDKVRVEKEKLEVELSKSTFDLVKENKLLEEQKATLTSKLESYNHEKLNIIKEIDVLRDQYNNTNVLCDKLLNEKQTLINDNQVLKDEIINLRDSYTKQRNRLIKSS
jgi:chromosome segregation ATPase